MVENIAAWKGISMRSLMIAAVGAVIAVGPVVGAGAALADHPPTA
ncbi:hypothetical protein [Nocardia miyunensis]|nr:hypothetical protein [Nocardia miyunensis]